ncbi:MAG: DUF3168 domain-containing protein [Pseudonocardiaceae bacterium]
MTSAQTPLLLIQAAIFSRLTADVTLAGLVTGVFDEVPEDAAHPYVVVGEAIETPRNAHAQFGREVVVTLHVWSRYRGFAQAITIVNRITALLDQQPMSIAGHAVVSVRHEFTQTLRDPDPEIRHVPIRFRVTTEQE